MKTIVLISCVSKKLDRSARAEELYISSLFTYSLKYARRLRPDAIYVLSAKYGLVRLDSIIAPYDMTLKDMRSMQVRRWAGQVIEQLRGVADLKSDHFIFLAGDRYRKYLIPHITHYEIPVEGLPIGKQLHRLKELTRE